MGAAAVETMRVVSHLLDDELDMEEPAEVTEVIVRSRIGRSLAAKRAADYVKSKIGLPRRTEANMLVVQRMTRQWLEERGLRPTHIAQIAPIADELSFVPTKADVLAQQLRATQLALDRQDAYAARYFSHPRSWLGRLFGIRRFGPAMEK